MPGIAHRGSGYDSVEDRSSALFKPPCGQKDKYLDKKKFRGGSVVGMSVRVIGRPCREKLEIGKGL